MQCDDIEIKLPAPPHLNELDAALHELGMLASYTNSKQEYIKELQQKQFYNMLTINTRYVSNVSIGFQVRPVAPHVRYKPYNLPKREERHRTKSENNDISEATNIVKAVLEESADVVEEIIQLKKAKSLESIVSEGKDIRITKINFPELEVVSDCIERLKVE